MLNLLIHYSHHSCLLYSNDIIDDDSLHGEKLLQLLTLLYCLTLFDLSLYLLFFSQLSLLLLLLQACLSQLEQGLLKLLLEFVDLVLPDAPDVLLCIGQVVFSLSSNMNFIRSALFLNQKAHLHKDLMELL